MNNETEDIKKDETVSSANEQQSKQETKRTIVSKDKLLEAGAYFGHRKSMWNPKMKEFLFPYAKRGLHMINTNITLQRLEFAYNVLLKFVQKNPRTSFIFVGTKKQARDTIKENALRTGSFYVCDRWLGGTLTNAQTIFKRVKAMEELEELEAENFEGYTKKEAILMQKELAKLHKDLNGIRNMYRIPSFMIVADPNVDNIAVREARKKGVKIIGILDSNTDPDLVDFGIPANDDSAKCIALIITVLADAIAVARGGKAKFAYQPDEEVILPEYKKSEDDKKDNRRGIRRNYNRDGRNRKGSRRNYEQDEEDDKIEDEE